MRWKSSDVFPWVACFLAATLVVAGQTNASRSMDPLPGLRTEHPRLLATAQEWSELRERLATDAGLARIHQVIVADAQRLLDEPPVERAMVGRRLLAVSRELVRRIVTLSYAWQTTRDRVFAQRAEIEMLAAAGFSDWNPGHFLDVAEAATAVAIGYDWCHDALSPGSRDVIRQALIAKALQPGLDPTASHNQWHRQANNWNQVCFAGLTLAALVVAEHEPDLARQVLQLARNSIHHGLAPYAPDGAYPEGPGYWSYGTTYQVVMIAALESALSDSWQMESAPGFLASAGAVVQLTAPSGRYYNFADCWSSGAHEPVMGWFARRSGDFGLLKFTAAHLEARDLDLSFDGRSRFFALTPLWWPPQRDVPRAPRLPRRWWGRGVNPVVVFRDAWDDPQGAYLALKGGAAEINHGHMDAGSFIYESEGVRWVVDLGPQEYESLESAGLDLWNRTQTSPRWTVYRLNNDSHSTLTIDGQRHRVDGHASVACFNANDPEPFAVIDLSPVFAGQAEGVRRGFRVLPGRRVLIQDELHGLQPGSQVRWQLPTPAEVEVDGAGVVLRNAGQALRASLIGHPPVAFSVGPAEPPEDGINARNPGIRMVTATFTAPAEGKLSWAILLAPLSSPEAEPAIIPLEDWAGPAVAANPR